MMQSRKRKQGLKWGIIFLIGVSLYKTFDTHTEYRNETQVNYHLPNTFRIVIDGSVEYATSMPPLASAVRNEYSEVTAATTLRKGEKIVFEIDQTRFLTKRYFYVGEEFFEVFNITTASGNTEEAFSKEKSIILTDRFSKSLFGGIDPIGKSIKLDSEVYTVLAIVHEDNRSHLDSDFFLPMSNFVPPSYSNLSNWRWLTFYTYVKLTSSNYESVIENQLETLIQEHGGENLANAIDAHLQPAEEIYFDERFSEDGQVQIPGLIDLLRIKVFLFSLLSMCGFVMLVPLNKWVKLGLTTILLGISIASFLFFQAEKTRFQQNHSQLNFVTDNWVIEFDHPLLQKNYNEFKKDIESDESIFAVGGSNHIMEGIYGTYTLFEGTEKLEPDFGTRMNFYPVHYDFFKAMGIPFVNGDTYSRTTTSSDSLRKLILNEEAAEQLGGKHEVLHKQLFIDGQGGMPGEVVGIVEDFNIEDISKPIKPLVCFFREDAFDFVVIRPNEGFETQALNAIKNVWRTYYSDIKLDIAKMENREDFILYNETQLLKTAQNLAVFCLPIAFGFIVLITFKSKTKQ